MKLKVSSLAKDYIASNIRSQLITLQGVLMNIEAQAEFDNDYAVESLKRMEINLGNIRRYLED